MKKESHFSNVRIACLFYLFRLIPVKKSKIVFCNYVGKGYGCNPKYIAEEIISRNKNWDMVWLTNYMETPLPKQIRAVKYESIKAVYELATAKFWVDNQRKLSHYKKRKLQCFIETWHGGGGPMKKIGADNPRNFDNKPYAKTSKHMDKIVNIMISNSTCCTGIYRSAFLYSGAIMECGYPRNDILVNSWSAIRPRVYDYFKLPLEQKTVLYAPTYRNTRDLSHYELDVDILLRSLTERFSGSWTLLMRLHPTMLGKAKDVSYDERVMNASYYDDMQELLAGCDILISDYSSVISEFAITRKPVFLFATDVLEYAVERDFYIDYYTLPFPIAEDNNKLANNILNFKEAEYGDKVTEYLEKVGMKETGNAAEQIVNWMEEWAYGN